MENSAQFDLNQAICRWRHWLSDSPSFRKDDLEELESHLRASIQTLTANGLGEEEAFLVALRRLGYPESLEREFAKVNSIEMWLSRASWMLTGILLWQIILPLARAPGFFAFEIARNIFPEPYRNIRYIPMTLGAVVMVAMEAGLVFIGCRFVIRRQNDLAEWIQRLLNRPLAATLGLLFLWESLHALDRAISSAVGNTWTPHDHLPAYDGSVVGVFKCTERFLQSIEVWQRPFGTGAMLYSIVQFAPQVAILTALVMLARRRHQKTQAVPV
jgi:hypothetical protein